MIRAIEDDIRRLAPKEWGAYSRATALVEALLVIAGTFAVVVHVDEWWAKAIGCLLVTVVPLVALGWRIRRAKRLWRQRTGLEIRTLDDIQRCIAEEKARFVLEHSSVKRNPRIIEAEISAIKAHKEVGKLDPFFPKGSLGLLAFFGASFHVNTLSTLFSQGKIEVAVAMTGSMVIVVIVGIVTYTHVRDFLLQREIRLDGILRALIDAKASLEGTGDLASWWKGSEVPQLATSANTDGIPPLPQ
ncbi:hypothetical protein FJV41_09940 [Myxococcus llanfairpwllgwyngyllgogerychwyrndrobwllllantysiliogogogochensis]|uniref:Uncharacterized protein n=1 Tax=Myxococcus llanfairpwllgwyngyllgogerychwyrndrobwllllantysiliogogogochensis TaxID=2590453 RepID=A0A540X5U5_9BACT|nr:hypothetical protein [Myxococcus llanfairpwllgwyngyllgogerychwyrndrobwllllantysiliogogogochensis]TQF16104.1 hypothetical protein FJV41_09940 [Myxococcus llanfairpwllgwyngyllgogerychwyrndrobwllllantysiliogogogochensis]